MRCLRGIGLASLALVVIALPGAAVGSDTPPRPQEPQPPFPYHSEEVLYRNGETALAGTLTYPNGDGPYPALVMLSGSGAQDRDETVAGHKPFLVIADALTRAGYAVLRVDDRGVGGSGGKLQWASFDLVADDALAGVEYLKGRAQIDPSRIGLFGHSEGGYIAPLAASRSGAVAFVVSMAGPAVAAEEVLVKQTRLILAAQGATPTEVAEQVTFIRRVAPLLRAQDYRQAEAVMRDQIEADSASLPAEQRPTATQVDEAVAEFVSPHMHAFFSYDPAPALTALDVPVLAFFGGSDLQVPAAQSAPVMRRLLAGNPAAEVVVFPGLNHLMQPSETGNPAEYRTIPTTVAPQVLAGIVRWLDENVRD